MSTEECGRARWLLSRAVGRLETTQRGPQRPLEHLEALRHAQERIDLARDLLVLAARDEGRSWGQIGAALGISRQAARQADVRRRGYELRREEDRAWRMTTPPRPRRLRWFTRWRRAA